MVYRVQHKETRQGPYRDTRDVFALENMEARHSYDESVTHPMPSEDKGIDRARRKGELCGFHNRRQLESWFTPAELTMLSQENFEIITVPDATITAIGEKQILFTKPNQ